MRQKARTIDINGKPHTLYIKNPDGTYSYDLDYIKNARSSAGVGTLDKQWVPIFSNEGTLHEGNNNLVSGDIFTYNGGHIGLGLNLGKNWKGRSGNGKTQVNVDQPFRVFDQWDLQFLKEPNRSLFPAFSRWLTKHPNKLTNYIRNIDGASMVGGNPFMLDMYVNPNEVKGFYVDN